MKLITRKWLWALVAVVAIGVFAAFSFSRKSGPQYFTAKVERGDIHDVVEATGNIDAVTTVQVGSQVSGTISKLSADFNSRVKAGQVIAQIDPSLFQGAVLQAKADLQNAEATAAAAKANLLKAQATATQAQQQYARTQSLADEGVMSRQQLDADKATADSAVAAVSAAQAELVQAQAQVAQKRAALDVAQTNLDHTIIRSPIDGIVTNRTVDVGQTVAASLQAPNLFNIAQDLSKMRVYAKIDESDVGQIKIGQPVTFKVDAYPKDTFQGRVEQVRLNPTTVQNVVTYDAVVAFDNPQNKLYPGMTAYVTIPVTDATNVLKVPDSALRFTPSLKPDQLRALYEKYGINQRAAQKTNDNQQRPEVAVLWKLGRDNQLQPVQVRVGITDHTYTEVAQTLKGNLQAGDQMAIGSSANGSQKPASGAGVRGGAGMMR